MRRLVLGLCAICVMLAGVSFLVKGTESSTVRPTVTVASSADGAVRVSIADERPPLRWSTLKWPLIAISVMVVLFVTAQQVREFRSPARYRAQPTASTFDSRPARKVSPGTRVPEWTAPLPDYRSGLSNAGD